MDEYSALRDKLGLSGIQLDAPAVPPPMSPDMQAFSDKMGAAGLSLPPAESGPPPAPYGPPRPPMAMPAPDQSAFRDIGAAMPRTDRSVSQLAAVAPPPDVGAPSGAPPSAMLGQDLRMPVPQSRYVAAHWDKGRDPLRAETRKQLQSDIGAEVKAEEGITRANDAASVLHADAIGQAVDDANNRVLDRQVKEQGRQEYMRTQRAKADQILDDVSTQKIDPNRAFGSASTGDRIAFAIGGMLGGLSQSLNHLGSNPFIDQMNKIVDRDIDAQKEDLAGKKYVAGQKLNLLGQARQDLGDERESENVAQRAIWQTAQMRIEQQMAQAQSPIIKANGEKALTLIKEKLTALDVNRDQIMHVNAQVTGGTPAQKGFVIKLPDGRQVRAPNEQKYNEMTTKSAQVQNIQGNIDKALAIRKGASTLELANPMSTVSKQLKSLQAETAQLVTVARGQGAMSKGDQAVADDAIGEMGSVFPMADKVLSSTRGRIGEQLSRDVDALGAEHVETGYTTDAAGRLQPTSEFVGQADKPAPNRPKSGKPVGQ